MSQIHLKCRWGVYVDWTCEDPPRPFYVGKGNESRINKERRNQKHTVISTRYGWRRELVFESNEHREVLAEEQRLITIYKTFTTSHITCDGRNIGCNFTKGGDGTYGYKHREETRALLSLRAKLREPQTKEVQNRKSASLKRSWKNRQRWTRRIAQYTLEGEFICEFTSIKEAAAAVGCPSNRISKVAKGKASRCGGFIWKYA